MSTSEFNGTIDNVGTFVGLTNATANINLAYSGSLGEGFTDGSNFTEFFAGGLNGFAADLGFNYQLKDENAGIKLMPGHRLKTLAL